ncbi:MAG: oxidoreductase [Paenibacillus sp.]|nr:oxidoreductase [Paenibacillus sp.]
MRTKTDKANVGAAVIGLGRGKAHIESLLRSQGAELLAVCDKNEAALEQFKEKYGVDGYTNLDDMLLRDDIDLVHVCTPSGLHTEMLLKIAAAGKHAITEKPLDITLERIDQAIEAFSSRGLQLGCIFQNRLTPAVREMKKAIDNKRLGKLVLANAHVKWYRSQEYYDQNGGWRITQVAAHTIETEDLGVALLKFASGALGTIVATTAAYPGFGTTLEVMGSDGGIVLKDNKIAGWKIRGEQMAEEEQTMLAADFSTKDTTFIQIQDMVDAVRNNRTPLISGREGRDAVEIVLAIYESARTGKEVVLPMQR